MSKTRKKNFATTYRTAQDTFSYTGYSSGSFSQTHTNIGYAYRGNDRRQMTSAGFWSLLCTLIVLLLISIALLSSSLREYIKVYNRSVDLYSSMDETFTIFAVEYKNASGEVTIKGQDGEKVVAPGTESEYTLNLRNSDDIVLDYSFTPSLKCSSGDKLPILIRILDSNRNYVLGDETTWISLDQIGDSECKGTLMPNETTEYVFQWQWPFESGDDSHDTFLGSSSAENDVSVDLSFSLRAEANLTVAEDGRFVGSFTGKPIMLFLSMLLVAIAIVILLTYTIRKRTETRYFIDASDPTRVTQIFPTSKKR